MIPRSALRTIGHVWPAVGASLGAFVIFLTVDIALGPSTHIVLRVVGGVAAIAVVAALFELVVIGPLRATLGDALGRTAELRTSATSADARLGLIHQLDHALRTADNDGDALDALGRAIVREFDDRVAEVLLATAGDAHLKWRIEVAPSGLGLPRSIDGRPSCRALVSSSMTISAGPDDIDRCAHIDDSDDPAAIGSACCVPIIADREPLGVLFLGGPLGDVLDDDRRDLLLTLVNMTGDRIALLRGRRARRGHGPVDALTDLATRPTAERRIAELSAQWAPFALAVGDFDHFGELNEHEGTDTGDQILRAYGQVLRRVLRPDDLAARIGGDRFLLILEACDETAARGVVERIRESFSLELSARGLPPVAVSVGITGSLSHHGADDLLEAAKIALLEAKAEGGNRAAVAGDLG